MTDCQVLTQRVTRASASSADSGGLHNKMMTRHLQDVTCKNVDGRSACQPTAVRRGMSRIDSGYTEMQ